MNMCTAACSGWWALLLVSVVFLFFGWRYYRIAIQNLDRADELLKRVRENND